MKNQLFYLRSITNIFYIRKLLDTISISTFFIKHLTHMVGMCNCYYIDLIGVPLSFYWSTAVWNSIVMAKIVHKGNLVLFETQFGKKFGWVNCNLKIWQMQGHKNICSLALVCFDLCYLKYYLRSTWIFPIITLYFYGYSISQVSAILKRLIIYFFDYEWHRL